MSTTSNDDHWLELITPCRASGLTDRQWCIENGIPVSVFYYHVRALRKKPVKFRNRWTWLCKNRKLSRSCFGKLSCILLTLFLYLHHQSAWKCRVSVLRFMNRPGQMCSGIPCLPCVSFVRRFFWCPPYRITSRKISLAPMQQDGKISCSLML